MTVLPSFGNNMNKLKYLFFFLLVMTLSCEKEERCFTVEGKEIIKGPRSKKKGRFWWILEDFEGFTRILKLFDRFQSLFPSIWGRWSLENPSRTHPEPVLESISLDLEGFSSFCPGYEDLFPSRICAKSLFWTLKMDKMTVSEAWKWIKWLISKPKRDDFEVKSCWSGPWDILPLDV